MKYKTDTLQVARDLDVIHHTILLSAKKIVSAFPEFREHIIESAYYHSNNREYPKYNLTKIGVALIHEWLSDEREFFINRGIMI